MSKIILPKNPVQRNDEKPFPASLGYRMPGEWAPHEATWLAWPHNDVTWPGKLMTRVRDIYLQMLEALLDAEKVHLLVNDKTEEDQVVSFLRGKVNQKNLVLHHRPTVDAWIRDYGPTFVRGPKGEKAWIKWNFNAWGGKYQDLAEDTKVFTPHPDPLPLGGEGRVRGDAPKNLIPHPCFDAGFVLEGGSIEVNGEGTVLTTEQCLLHKNRNPHFSKSKIEELLRNYLGVSQVLWLGEGIEGDDTDGHIDDIARFADARTILAAYEEDETDRNFKELHENWRRLERSEDERGRKWNLVKLPMPPRVADGKARLPASYANFLIANKSVLLPVYSHAKDKRAAGILKDLFPKHEIVPIECTALVYGLGAIHCVTQQEPA